LVTHDNAVGKDELTSFFIVRKRDNSFKFVPVIMVN
jgi:hypothetical protein